MAIAVDASSPALAKSSSAGAVTASFTPPANSLLVAACWSSFSGNALTYTVTDSQGLTWTNINIHNTSDSGGQQGVAALYWAVAVSSVSMTVTSTISAGNFPTGKVYVITGADNASPVGGQNEASNTSTSFTTTGYTIARDGSLGLVCMSNTTGGATIASSDHTYVTDATTGHNGLAGYKALGAAGGSATAAITVTGSPANNWVTAEIQAPVAAPVVLQSTRNRARLVRASSW